jgi:host factor-I protein
MPGRRARRRVRGAMPLGFVRVARALRPARSPRAAADPHRLPASVPQLQQACGEWLAAHCNPLRPSPTVGINNKNQAAGIPMSNDKKQNLQDTFLNAVRKSRTPLTIFLVNGVKLQGVVTWFDNFCVLLRRDGQVQLVYKHAISTIMPSGPVQMFETDPAVDD